MHRTTTITDGPSWRDHTDRDAREAAILTDLACDTEMVTALGEPSF